MLGGTSFLKCRKKRLRDERRKVIVQQWTRNGSRMGIAASKWYSMTCGGRDSMSRACNLQVSKSGGRWSMAPPSQLGLRGSGVTRVVFASLASDSLRSGEQ